MLRIDFYASGAENDVAAVIEQQLKKAVESLRCPSHLPGRVSFRVNRAHVQVVGACCTSFLQAVKDAVGNALASDISAIRALKGESRFGRAGQCPN